MADLTDVFNSLVNMAAIAVYPNGTSQPSVCGKDVVVYAGWAIASRLDDDLKMQKVHASVYARPDERNTTRYLPDWQDLDILPVSITLTVAGDTVIVGGLVAPNHNLLLVVNGKNYSYSVQTSDTLNSIAQSLAGLISVDMTVIVSGSVITIPAAFSVVARVGTFGESIRELRRQERTFQIVIWAATPQLRDTVASAIDVYFAKFLLSNNQQITLSDQSIAKIIYRGSPITDDLQKDRLYRRDLLFSVDYATTEIKLDPVIIAPQLDYSSDSIIETFVVNQSNSATVSSSNNVPDHQVSFAHPFNFGDVPTLTIYSVPAGSVISTVSVVITTPFNVASTINVGDSSGLTTLFNMPGFDLMSTGIYECNPTKYYSAQSTVIMTLNTGSGATQGSGIILINIQD